MDNQDTIFQQTVLENLPLLTDDICSDLNQIEFLVQVVVEGTGFAVVKFDHHLYKMISERSVSFDEALRDPTVPDQVKQLIRRRMQESSK